MSLPCTLAELLDRFNQNNSAAGLFPYEGECNQTVKSQLQQIKKGSFDSIWAFIGSEGGFSLGEVRQFEDSGLSPVTLGEQVLRVETACVSLASIIKYELVDK